MRFTATWVLSLFLLTACSVLGLTAPKGFDQQLAEAYGVHTAVLQAATTAVSTHAISPEEATQINTQALSARTMLDAAKAAETAGNTKGANTDLQLAVTALTALQTYLNSRNGAK